MKKNLIKVIVVILAFAVVLGFFLSKKDDRQKRPSSSVNTNSSTSETSSNGENNIEEILKNLASVAVYAPENCTVLLGEKELPFVDAVNCYRIIEELSGKHTLSVSKSGYETFTKEIDLDKEKSHEITVELVADEKYIDEAILQAEEILRKIIDVCNSGNADLSDFHFYNEKEKSRIQKTVDTVINDLSVDTEEYKTEKIIISEPVCDNKSDLTKNTVHSTEFNGFYVTFTFDSSYNWKYESEAYQNSGTDASKQIAAIRIDCIDGKWCIRDLQLFLKKTLH